MPDESLCAVTWGVCPDHGATLEAAADRTTCRSPDCPRTWDYDRFAAPCPESASHRLRDSTGGALLLCPGHAVAVRKQLPGADITPLDPGQG